MSSFSFSPIYLTVLGVCAIARKNFHPSQGFGFVLGVAVSPFPFPSLSSFSLARTYPSE